MKQDPINRQDAIDALNDEIMVTGKANAIAVQDYIRKVNLRLHDLPSAQPEEDKLKKIADALSEKMSCMNTCPNERDIILGYLGVKRSSKNHCNTDCWNEKCESYHYETRKQPEPCDDPRADVYYLAEKIGIHRLYALVVELRGEPEPCEDAVSRQAAIDAIEETDWYHQKNKDMMHGANSQEHQAWYKAEDIYQALDRLPSVQPEKANEQIKKEIIDAIKNADVVVAWDDEADDYDVADIAIRATKNSVIESIEALPSAQPEPEHTMEEFMYGQDLGSPEDGSL